MPEIDRFLPIQKPIDDGTVGVAIRSESLVCEPEISEHNSSGKIGAYM